MKNKNQRELEKYWAEQAVKKAKAVKKQPAPKPDAKQAGEEPSGKSAKK